MASSSSSSPLGSKVKVHARSISLPSRSSHPLISQFNDYLQKVIDSEATPSISLSSMSGKVRNLEYLYDCVDDLLLLPHSQQVFAQECQEKWVDQTLDGCLRLLDSCTATKDVLSNTKQDLQEVISVLRRRRDAEVFCGFFISRKKAKKMIHKTIKEIKSIRNKPSIVLEKNHETIALVSMLKEVEFITSEVLESLLSYVVGAKECRWNLVSKLTQTKRVSSFQEDEADVNEFEKLDSSLLLLAGGKTNKSGNHENLQIQLRVMESGIQFVEEGLECLFKRLIKMRVSLLNIVNH
ncbi:hypothetical protein Adt_18158 [Abeliophyllum distichum]|uniref:DUF241 domain protein n=1 Tax=Abeliophyllum distichum TaxID=126358 RepID=A0ABD1TIW5_9LAMI